jgi:hexosaminidase
MVTDEMLDGRLWPRALALGERFWSTASLRDPDDLYARLVPALDQLRALGLADQIRRNRMIARLAPDEPEIVGRLVGLVAPIRFSANHMDAMLTGKEPELVELSDTASTDPSPARRFRVEVTAYLSGDKSRSSVLRTELRIWSDNKAAFERIAAGRPLLEKAIPTANDIAALGDLGTLALDAIEERKTISPTELAAGRELLTKLKNFDAATQEMASIMKSKLPPAALIILTTRDVERLVDAATKAGGA